MALIYNTALKNARLQKVIDAIDAGPGNGVLRIGTTAMAVVLSSITLAKPSFGAPAGGSMSLAGVPLIDTDADATGAAASADILDSTGTVVVSGLTVGTTAADIILSTTAITVNQEVRINSGVIAHG